MRKPRDPGHCQHDLYWNALLDSPAFVLDSYLRMLQLVSGLPCNCYLSIKAAALAFDAEPVKEIVFEAERTNTTVHFDSMGPETVDRTFELIEAARRIHPNIGCTLPARWRRSVDDVDRVVDLGLRVRLVKGQWAGANGDDVNPIEGFLRLTERLISKRARHVAVAIHNPVVARETLEQLRNSGVSFELELLHRLPQRRMLKIARQQNASTRVYVPYGHAGMLYRLKEAVRDPRIIAWFMRDLIRA